MSADAMLQTEERVPVLSLKGIHKTFGGVVAIDRFDLDIYAGEVVALVGDNGAGKSTLVKIIAGVHQPNEGTVQIDGKQVSMIDPATPRRSGSRSSIRTLPSRIMSRSIWTCSWEESR